MNKVTSYLKNVGKSMTFATVDVVGTMIPEVKNFTDTNSDIFKAVYATATKSTKSAYYRKNVFKDNVVFKDLNKGLQNIKDDIKTGNFYNKDRELKEFQSAFGYDEDDFFSDFDDFDLDSLDGDDSGSSDSSVSITKGDLAIADSVVKSSNLSSQLISKTVANTSNSIIKGNIANTRMVMTQNIQLVAGIRTSIAGVHESINKILKFSYDVVPAHFNTQVDYFNNSINIMKENNAILKEMLDLQKTVYAPKKGGYKNKDNPYDDIFSGGTLNIAEYAKVIKKNIKNLDKTGSVDMLLADDGSGGTMLGKMLSNPLGMVMGLFLPAFMPKNLSKQMASFSKTLENIFPALIAKVNTYKKESGIGTKSKILKFIGDIFGIDTTTKTEINTGKYNKEAVPFDGITRKAIVDVIPEHLSRIESLLSGASQRVYDYHSGKWMDSTEIEKKKKEEYEYLIKNSFREFQDQERVFFNELALDAKTKASVDKDLMELKKAVFENGGYLSPNKIKKDIDKYGFANKEIMEAILDVYAKQPVSKFGSVAYNTNDNRRRHEQMLYEYETQGDSVYRKLYDKSNNNSHLKFHNEFTDEVIGTKSPNNLLNIKDNNGFNALDYLRKIYINLSYIRETGTGGTGEYSEIKPFDEYEKSFKRNYTPKNIKARYQKRNEEAKKYNKYNAASGSLDDRLQKAKSIAIEQSKFSDLDYEQTEYGSFYTGSRSSKWKETMEQIKGDTFFDKWNNADSASAKQALILGSLSDIAKKPAALLTGMIQTAETSIYRFLFDAETNEVDEDGNKVDGFFSAMLKQMKDRWSDLTSKIEEKFINPIVKKYGLDEKWEKIKEKIKDTKAYDFASRVKDSVVDNVSTMYTKAKSSVIDVMNDNPYTSQAVDYFKSKYINKRKQQLHNEAKGMTPEELAEFKKTLSPQDLKILTELGFNRGGRGTVEESGFIPVSKGEEINVTTPEQKEREEEETNAILRAMKNLINGKKDFLDGSIAKVSKVKGEMEGKGADTVAKSLLGGGVGLLAGIPGGPLVGAVLGAALSFVKNSQTINKALFGEREYDENGIIKDQKGGLISKEIQNTFNKYIPDMGKYGLTGAVASLMLPFGPLAGAAIGAGISFTKNSETMNNMIFGEEGLLNEKRRDIIKKFLPRAAVGAAAGMFLGPFGLLGNAAIGAGAGMLTHAEEFKELIFGEDDGFGNRIGGIKGALDEHFVQPIKDFGTNFKEDFFGFIKESMIDPLNDAITPIANEIAFQTKRVVFGLPKMIGKLGRDYIAVPLMNKIEDKVLNPILKLGKWTFGRLFSTAKGVVSAPFRAVGSIGNSLRKKQIRQGRDTGTAEDRLRFADRKNLGDYKYRTFDEKLSEKSGDEDYLKELTARTAMLAHGSDYFDKQVKSARKELSRVVSDYYKLGWFSKDKRSYKRIRQYIHDNNVEAAIEELTNIKDSRTSGGPLDAEANDAIARFSAANKKYQVARDNKNRFGELNEEQNATWMEQQFGPNWRKMRSDRLFDYSRKELSNLTGKTAITKTQVFKDPTQLVTKGESEINETLKDIYRYITEGKKSIFRDELQNADYDSSVSFATRSVDNKINKSKANIKKTLRDSNLNFGNYANDIASILYQDENLYKLVLEASKQGVNYDTDTVIKLSKLNLSKKDIDLLIKFPYVSLLDEKTIEKNLDALRNNHGTIFFNRLFGAKSIRNKNLGLLNFAEQTGQRTRSDLQLESGEKFKQVETQWGMRKYIKNSQGELELDMSDSETKESLQKEKDEKESKRTFMSSINSLKDGVLGIFNRNKEKDEEEEKEPWYKKLFNGEIGDGVKFGAAIIGTLTGIGALKTLWDNREEGGVLDTIGTKVGNAVGPYITKMKNWFTNEGEYADRSTGFAGFLDTKFFPNLLTGFNLIFSKVLPALVTSFIKNIPVIIKSAVKGVGQLFGWKDKSAGTNNENGAPDTSLVLANTEQEVMAATSGYNNTNNSWANDTIAQATNTANTINNVQVADSGATGDSGTSAVGELGKRLGYATTRSFLTGNKPLVFSKGAKTVIGGADNVLRNTVGRVPILGRMYKTGSSVIKAVSKPFEAATKLGSYAGNSFMNAFRTRDVAKEATEKAGKEVIEKGSTSALSKVAKQGASHNKGLLKRITSFIRGKIEKILNSNIVKNKIKDALKEVGKKATKTNIRNTINSIIDKFMKSVVKRLPKAGTSVIVKFAGMIGTGGLLTAAFAIGDFITGIDRAESILKIKDPNTVQTLLAGLVNIITNEVFFGLIDSTAVVDMLTDVIFPIFNIDTKDFKQKRAEAEQEARAYNTETGSDLSTSEYLEKTKSVKGKIKSAFSNKKKSNNTANTVITKGRKTDNEYNRLNNRRTTLSTTPTDQTIAQTNLEIGNTQADQYNRLTTNINSAYEITDLKLGKQFGFVDSNGKYMPLSKGINKFNESDINRKNKNEYTFNDVLNTYNDGFKTIADPNSKTSNKTNSGGFFKSIGNGISNAWTKFKGLFSGSGTGFVSQLDPKYKNKKFNISGDTQNQTLGDSGCAPATAANVINLFSGSGSIMDNASKAALKYKDKNGGVTPDYFSNYLGSKGIGTRSTTNKQEILAGISSGQPTILLGVDPTNKANTPYGASSSHYVLATGLDGKGNVIIQDPESRKPNALYPVKDVLNQSHMGMITGRGLTGKTKSITRELRSKLGKFGFGRGKDQIEKKVWARLRGAGYTEKQVAGAMGNIKHESGFDPSVIEGGSGIGFGLCQWSYGRRSKLESYAKSIGKKASDIDVQIDFLIAEMTPGGGANGYASYQFMTSSSAYDGKSYPANAFATADNIVTATKAFCFCFERPAYSSSVNHIDRRIESAGEYFEKYTGTPPDSGTMGDTSSSTNTANTLFDKFKTAALSYYDNSVLELFGINSSDASEMSTGGTTINTTATGKAKDVLTIAAKEIGTQAPSNQDTKYGRAYGMNNVDWCAIFCWWVFNEAGCSNLFYGGGKSALVPALVDYYKNAGSLLGPNEGQPGDLIFFDWNNNGSADHVGIIEKNNGNGSYTTIEGNTGDSAGGAVMRKERTAYVHSVARINYNSGKGSGSKFKSTTFLSLDGRGTNRVRKSSNYAAAVTTKAGKTSNSLKPRYNKHNTTANIPSNVSSIYNTASRFSNSSDSLVTRGVSGMGTIGLGAHTTRLNTSRGKSSGFSLPSLNGRATTVSGNNSVIYSDAITSNSFVSGSAEKLLTAILDVLQIIANNSDKLSEIVTLLSKSLDINLTDNDISKLSSNNAQIKNKIANALKKQGSANGMGNSVMNSSTESLASAMYAIARA